MDHPMILEVVFWLSKRAIGVSDHSVLDCLQHHKKNYLNVQLGAIANDLDFSLKLL